MTRWPAASAIRRSRLPSGFPSAVGTATATGDPLRSAEETGRALTWLEHEGEPLAVLVHDPSLLDEPELIQAAAATARLALENARLGAELHAQLDKVKESRARIVAAPTRSAAESSGISTTVRSNALSRWHFELRSAQRSMSAGDPELKQVLGSAVDELQVAVTSYVSSPAACTRRS